MISIWIKGFLGCANGTIFPYFHETLFFGPFLIDIDNNPLLFVQIGSIVAEMRNPLVQIKNICRPLFIEEKKIILTSLMIPWIIALEVLNTLYVCS